MLARMKMLRLFTLRFAALALLSACSGAPAGIQQAIPSESSAIGRDALPTVYTSIPDEGFVYGFGWLSFSIESQITLGEVQGLCSDKTGDLFVPTGSDVYEYAHGSSTPKLILDNTYEGVSCAVDPESGDLAVTNLKTRKGALVVNIFRRATGKPKSYSFTKFAWITFASYDDKGNLFIDGNGLGSRGFLLNELPSAGTKFVGVTVRKYIGSAGGVVWDGKYLAIADGKGAVNSTIYRFNVKGQVANLKDSMTLEESCGLRQFAVYHGTVVAASGCTGDADLGYWKYPAGGSPIAVSGNWGTNLAYGVALGSSAR
jgi:hypothetical protein